MTIATQPRPDTLRDTDTLHFVLQETLFRGEPIWAVVAQNTPYAYYTPDGRHYDTINLTTGDTLQSGLFSKRYCEDVIGIAARARVGVLV